MEQIQEQKANPSDVVSAADLVGATAQQKPQQGVVRSSEGGQSKGFQSHIARSIHAQLFGKEEELYGKRRQSEMFLPGRMAFEFSLDTEFQTELPTIITRSKSDCPRLSKKILPQMPDAVLERLEKSMHFVRQCILGKDGKRMKRKVRPTEEQPGAGVMGEAQHPSADRGQDEPAVPPPPPPPASNRKKEDDDSDDDIFAGVGKDYVCEVDETKEKKKQAGGYFGKEKSAEDQGDLSHQAVKNSVMSAVDGVPEQIKETMKARAAEEAKRIRAEKEKKLKRMMEDVPDEYSECYAGYHSNLDRLNVLMQDPDEDKKGKRKKGKGNSKEQELKDEQQRMNNKFNKDYNSIAGIMKDKYDEDIKNEPKRQRYL